jgi:creatinine amidohydrolase
MEVDVRGQRAEEALIDAFNTLVSIKPSWLKEHHFNIHADRYETSIALGVHPEKVKPENEWGAGSDFGHGKMASMFSGYKHLIPEDGKVSMGWVTTDLTDDGVIGDPIGANANEGKEFLGIIVSNISEILPEIASFAI